MFKNSFVNYIKAGRIFRKSAYTSTVVLLLLVLATIFPISLRSATPTKASAGTATESTLTFAFVNNKNIASVSLDVSSNNGSFASSNSNELAEFTLSTNNATGYTLKLRTSGEATTLSDGANMINTISAGGTTAEEFIANTWGLLPSKYNGVINSENYYPASIEGFTIDETSSANNAGANTYTVGLGIKADFTIPAGTYTNNTAIVEYVANLVAYNISYDKGNATSEPTNMPNGQSGSLSTTSVALSNIAPVLSGYIFKGWCLGTITTINKEDTCTGNIYNPNGDGSNLIFGIDKTTSNNVILHAIWAAISYNITVNAGDKITALTASGWSGNGTATITKSYHNGDIINLSEIVPTYTTGYTGADYTLASGVGVISGNTYTVGEGNGSITIKANGLNTPVCTMTGGATKVYNYSETTLTATDNSAYYDTNNVNITYSFGYASSTTADLGNFGTAQSGNTITLSKTAFSATSTRYYGVTIVVTDKTDSTFTATCTSGTGTGTGNTVANRATMSLVRSRVQFDATTNGGSILTSNYGRNPIYVYYNSEMIWMGSVTTASGGHAPYATKSGYSLKGWYTAPTGGSKVLNPDGTLTGIAVSGWTNASKQWVKTGVSDSSVAENKLYAQYVPCSISTISGYLQDASENTTYCDGASGTMIDRRDEQAYTVKKIHGALWMTRNLAIGCSGSGSSYGSGLNQKSLTSAYSNVASSWSTPTASLDKNDGTTGCTTSSTNGCNSATVARMKCDSTYGAWYNFAAASAGTMTSNEKQQEDKYNICPKGWTLGGKYQFYSLVSFTNDFSAVTGGYYSGGELKGTSVGYWWGIGVFNTYWRDILSWGSRLQASSNSTSYGQYVRCVRSW